MDKGFYGNILDVYEQTKKLKAEELAQIFDKNYKFNQNKLDEEVIDELKHSVLKIKKKHSRSNFIFNNLIIFFL